MCSRCLQICTYVLMYVRVSVMLVVAFFKSSVCWFFLCVCLCVRVSIASVSARFICVSLCLRVSMASVSVCKCQLRPVSVYLCQLGSSLSACVDCVCLCLRVLLIASVCVCVWWLHPFIVVACLLPWFVFDTVCWCSVRLAWSAFVVSDIKR